MAKIKTLNDLYVAQLKDMYYAEKQIVKTLPKMAKAASNPELKQGFTKHLEETKGHVARLEQVFEMLDMPAKAVKCEAITGILAEGAELMEEAAGGEAIDAALIMAAQKVEHYEITSYGSLLTFAKTLNFTDQVNVLKQTIAEEKTCDETLTQQAKTSANQKANTTANTNTKTTSRAA